MEVCRNISSFYGSTVIIISPSDFLVNMKVHPCPFTAKKETLSLVYIQYFCTLNDHTCVSRMAKVSVIIVLGSPSSGMTASLILPSPLHAAVDMTPERAMLVT